MLFFCATEMISVERDTEYNGCLLLGFLGGLALCYRNDFYGTRHRVEWVLTARFSVPLAVVDQWGGHG